jgi:hypothetical protein
MEETGMKRDYDLIRAILRDVEGIPPGSTIGGFEYEGVDAATVHGHAMLAYEAGLIKADVMSQISGPEKMKISGLTWAGHELLGSIKDPGTWDKIKAMAKPAGAMTIPLITELAAALLKAKAGLT